MEEILCSIRNYTKFSGEESSFYDMAQSALDCGLDAVFTTDRNVYPEGHTQFFYRDGKRVLVICGEELFDPLSSDSPHYLSLGAEREQFNRRPANLQEDIRILLDADRETNNFRHIELMNAQDLLCAGLVPGLKKIRENINNYDRLLMNEQRFVGIAGTCSQNRSGKFTYPELFSTVCNHVLSDEYGTGDLIHDKLQLLKSLRAGHLYMALDGLADARGFRFSAEGNNQDQTAYPGDIIFLKNSITFKITCPEVCTCRLIRNGTVMKEWQKCRQVPMTIYEQGYYRVECALTIRRNQYDWIFSTPIYVLKG
ncbi:MAG: hypothetical protein IKP86_11730 [Anaerolineaceae bacterium]|nr:hypothetical protein [Anaerolineaceae bacterium]